MRGRSAGPAVDVVIDCAKWRALKPEAVVRRAIATAAPRNTANADVSVLLTNDRAIRKLNAGYRNKDTATNVLSFPAAEVPPRPAARATTTRPLGDIVIAYETVAREAKAEKKPLAHHLAHLTVHGFLHLLGYDHESEGDAVAMERLERNILARLDIPDPYAARR